MADPITVTTTLVTFAGFVKDLVEVGQDIKRSIEKVRENRRQIRELANNILHTLASLANLTRGQEDIFQTPALLTSLGNLKAEMLHVLSACRDMSSADSERRASSLSFKSQIRAWMKRDDIEAKIRRLKKHVNKCYLEFTAFSAARIEKAAGHIEDLSQEGLNTGLRVEQRLIVNNLESQVKLRRIEGMMAQFLLQTAFGQSVLTQTVATISSDLEHQTLESQYLSVQTMRLIDSLQQLWTEGKVEPQELLWDPLEPYTIVFNKGSCSTYVLYQILELVLAAAGSFNGTQIVSLPRDIINFGPHLHDMEMPSESIAWELFMISIYRSMASNKHFAEVMPRLAHALTKISIAHGRLLEYDSAQRASEDSVGIWRIIVDTSLDVDNRIGLLYATNVHANNLLQHHSDLEAAFILAQECVALSRSILEELLNSASGSSEDEFKTVQVCKAFFILVKAFASLDRSIDAYETAFEGFSVWARLPRGGDHLPLEEYSDLLLEQMWKIAEDGSLNLTMLDESITLVRRLAILHPPAFSAHFLELLCAYAYFFGQDMDPVVPWHSLRKFVEPSSSDPPPSIKPSDKFTKYIDEHDNNIFEDIISAFFSHKSHPSQPAVTLLQTIFASHSDRILNAVQNMVHTSCLDRSTVLEIAIRTLVMLVDPAAADTKHPLLRGIIFQFVEQLNLTGGFPVPMEVAPHRWTLLSSFLKGNLIEEALNLCAKITEYSPSSFDVFKSLTVQVVVLWQMGWIQAAIAILEEIKQCPLLRRADRIVLLILNHIQTNILRRSSRNQEASQVVVQLLPKDMAQLWTDASNRWDDLTVILLLVQRSTICKDLGKTQNALLDAEAAVKNCQRHADEDIVEVKSAALIHSLTNLGSCLAAAGRHDEALTTANEAVEISQQYNWGLRSSVADITRLEEIGAGAFYSLSLRLVTCGEFDQALHNAREAIKLYRATLALRNLPTLAESLQNLASILAKCGRLDESILNAEEAVHIMRKVSEVESYFLPKLANALDQLAEYLIERGDVEEAAVIVSEREEVLKEFEALSPGPEVLFTPIILGESEDGHSDGDTSEDEDYSSVTEKGAEISLEVVEPIDRSVSKESIISKDTPLEHRESITALHSPENCLLQEQANFNSPVSDLVSGATKLEGEAAAQEKVSLNSIFSGPVELRLTLNVKTTPTDILWWFVLGILLLAVSLMWSRM